MLPIRVQYFLSFAVIGAVMPFLSVYLAEEKELAATEIGWLFGLSSVAVMVTPVLMTYLADRHLDARRLMTLTGIGWALSWLLVAWVDSFAALLPVFLLAGLTGTPVIPLQDGIFFSHQQHVRRDGRMAAEYHQVRVWGSIGFMAPGVLLYVLLRLGWPLEATVYCGAILALVLAANALFLPADPLRDQPAEGEDDEAAARIQSHPDVPTAAAVRACLEPHVLVFCIAMLLATMAASSYYVFYPVYLKQTIGIDPRWIGLITNIGVVIEIPCILLFGWMVRRVGLKAFMWGGMLVIALRVGLLWLFPVAGVAVGTQVLHGIMMLVIHVSPPLFLDRYAGDRFRHSMQGFYVVAVVGVGRLVGLSIAGHLADIDNRYVFTGGAVAALVAAALFVFAFQEKEEW